MPTPADLAIEFSDASADAVSASCATSRMRSRLRRALERRTGVSVIARSQNGEFSAIVPSHTGEFSVRIALLLPVSVEGAPLRHQGITFAVVLTATAAFSMLVSLVVPVLPLIQRDLGTNQGTITWVLTAYLLAASVATPIVGRIGDSYGKKQTLVAVLAAFG